MRRLLIALAIMLGLGAVIAFAGCSTLEINEEDVFLPKPSVTPASFDVDGVALEEMYFPVVDTASGDTLQLNAWHLTQPDAEATVLFFGGNGFYLVQSLGYIQALTDLPVNIFMWDYRGYGRSAGAPSVPGFKGDALTAYDYLTEHRGVDSSRVIVHGHSLGTFLASYVADRRSVAGVVLENPATDVNDWVGSVIPWYVRLFVNVEVDETLQGESNSRRLQRVTAPLLVVGGEQDNVTPPDMARALHESAASPRKDLVMVPDGGHNELYTTDAYRVAYRCLLARAQGEPCEEEQ